MANGFNSGIPAGLVISGLWHLGSGDILRFADKTTLESLLAKDDGVVCVLLAAFFALLDRRAPATANFNVYKHLDYEL